MQEISENSASKKSLVEKMAFLTGYELSKIGHTRKI